jgi:hypothetical protein
VTRYCLPNEAHDQDLCPDGQPEDRRRMSVDRRVVNLSVQNTAEQRHRIIAHRKQCERNPSFRERHRFGDHRSQHWTHDRSQTSEKCAHINHPPHLCESEEQTADCVRHRPHQNDTGVVHLQHFGHKRNAQQHGDYIGGRLERLEVAVVVGVPVEDQLGVEEQHWFLVALEGVEEHAGQQEQ